MSEMYKNNDDNVWNAIAVILDIDQGMPCEKYDKLHDACMQFTSKYLKFYNSLWLCR